MSARIGIELTAWSNRRGYGRFVREIVTALVARRDEIEWVFFVDPRTAPADLPRQGEIVPLPGLGNADGAGARSLGQLRAAGRAIAAHPLDLLCFPSVHAWVPVPTKAPILLGIHDVIAEDYPRLVFPRLADRWRWQAKSAWARRQATAIFTVSEHARDGLVRRFDLAAERVFVVEEAPAEEFRPLAPHERDDALLRRLGLAPGAPVVAYLGGINPHKNLAALVDAVVALRRRPGLEAARLLVVGDYEDQFTPGIAALREHIRARRAEDAVAFTGFLADAAVAQVLNAAALLALASWSEGFGLPAVEAAACGTPVVATSRSPLPRLLEGGGLFVDPGKPDELEAALGRILGDAALRARMGATARARAAELSWERSAGQFLAAVERVRSLA